MTVPKYIADAAATGLAYRRDGLGGAGLADSTITAARRMAAGTVSDEKIILANAWAARHAVDLEAPKNSRRSDPGFPGPGFSPGLRKSQAGGSCTACYSCCRSLSLSRFSLASKGRQRTRARNSLLVDPRHAGSATKTS